MAFGVGHGSMKVSRRLNVWTIVLIVGSAHAVSVAQSEPNAPDAPPGRVEHVKQLNTCRAGVLDANARDADRRRWAELLFTYETPESIELVVDLLSPKHAPAVRRTVCEVLGETVRADASRGVPAFVPPLLELLGAQQPALRSAAAGTLAEFPPAKLAPQLGAIAADDEAPVPMRLAAIDALGRNMHVREVVAQLVALLSSASPEVRGSVVEHLEPASVETFGEDVERWQAWWSLNEALTDEQWLERQVEIYRQRARALSEEFASFRRRMVRERDSTVSYVRTLQSELFRALPPEQRRAKLVEWLGTTIGIVRLTALDLIKSRIADEGQSPDGAVLRALVRVLLEGDDAEQRAALLIVQNVHDPAVVEAVLSRLEAEADPTMRLGLLTALGRMRDPAAIPALVAELERPQATPAMVREAAAALGRIAQRVEEMQTMQAAVEPLQRRFEQADADDTALRAALLSAMAGTGDRSFAPIYSEALNSDHPRLLQPAIRGLRSIGDRTRLPRIRDLTGNNDPLVRLDAIMAVAELGRDAEDLQSLLIRLNPSIESNELAREAAWAGFREYMSRRSLSERIDAAQRLRDTPNLEVRYLSELAETIATTGADPAELQRVRDRLATVLVGLGRYADGAGQYRLLFQRKVDRGEGSAVGVGLRWLDATLRADPVVELADVVERVAASAKSETDLDRLIDTVVRYVEGLDVASDPARARRVAVELNEVDAEGWPPRWTELLRGLDQRLGRASGDASPD